LTDPTTNEGREPLEEPTAGLRGGM
jgi:hypothetical protein